LIQATFNIGIQSSISISGKYFREGKRVFIGADCFIVAKAKITIGSDIMIAPK